MEIFYFILILRGNYMNLSSINDWLKNEKQITNKVLENNK